MADRKISDLTALTTPASGDYLPIVDISEGAAASKNKRITIEELMRGAPDGTAAAPSIAFESDPNTGIYSPGADQLAISTNGTGRLFVDASGRLGLGTSSPAHKLDVAGGVNSTGLNVTGFGGFFNAASKFGVDNNGGVTRMYSSGPDASTRGSYDFRATDSVGTLDTSRMVIDSSGNVGIGTTSPTTRFSCIGSTAILGATNVSANFSDNTNSTFAIGHPSGGGVDLIGNVGLNFCTSSGSVKTEAARIDSSGRLLVGTSTSRSNAFGQAVHQVEGTNTNAFSSVTIAENSAFGGAFVLAKSRGTAFEILSSGDNLGILSFQGADGSALREAARIDAQVDGTPGANDMPGRLVFSTTADGAASPTERLRITSAGNVGIGTSSPDSTLHVIAGAVAGFRVGYNGLSQNYYDADVHTIRNIAGAQNVVIGSTGEITIIDAGNITVGTTTGTKIGTATTQKIGFYDATPVVQPTAVADATDAATVITQLNALLTRMRNLGLIAT
jgi:hypothetical protein